MLILDIILHLLDVWISHIQFQLPVYHGQYNPEDKDHNGIQAQYSYKMTTDGMAWQCHTVSKIKHEFKRQFKYTTTNFCKMSESKADLAVIMQFFVHQILGTFRL